MSGDRTFHFDENAADRAEEFFADVLRHSKGEWAGEHFLLEPWQRDEVIRPLFGSKRADGTRRYRTLWLEVAKKNGKSTLLAGIALYLLFVDGEPSAEIYSSAGDMDQAAIIHRVAKDMVKASRALSRRAQNFKKSIVDPSTGSFYQVISSDAETKDGINPHGVVVDEVHRQPNRKLWDVLTHGGGARRQPLTAAATTAGLPEPGSIAWILHNYALKVRDGLIDDPSWLVVIYAADAELDKSDPNYWATENAWRAANPNYGISVKPEFLREQCLIAQSDPASQNTFKRLHLNLWTEQVTRWLPMDKWDSCAGAVPVDEIKARRRPCWAGLDLASTTDLAAMALIFPPERAADPGLIPELWYALWWFWIPQDRARERQERDRVPYLDWSKKGLLELTPGDVIDYAYIRARARTISSEFALQECGFDPWNATQLATELKEADGIQMVEVRQGMASLAEPTRRLEEIVISGALRHGGNPVARWCASNVAIRADVNGNKRPDKEHSIEKIDAVVALIIALARAIVSKTVGSIYERRGILTL